MLRQQCDRNLRTTASRIMDINASENPAYQPLPCKNRREVGDPDEEVSRFFVYGTLKRDQCRATCWPVPPLHIEEAITPGSLFDLGEYPAMQPGPGFVLGEIWHIPLTGLAETCQVLDAIEGFQQPNQADEYKRVIVPVRTASGSELEAFCYFYCHSSELTPECKVSDHHLWQNVRCARWPFR